MRKVMARNEITKERAKQVIGAVNKAIKKGYVKGGNPSPSSIAALELGVATRTINHIISRARDLHGITPDWGAPQDAKGGEEALHVTRLMSENAALQAQLKSISSERVTRENIRNTILELRKYDPKPPRWMIKPKKSVRITGVPTLFASDWQLGEVINPTEINNYNGFNLEIAERRIETMMRKTMQLLFEEVARPKYPGIVLLLGGDMVSGDSLHEDLTKTNEERVLPVVLRLVDLNVGMILELLERFEHVHVVVVPGNHGRQTHKPPSKERNVTNYDWFAGVLVERHFQTLEEEGGLEKGRVTFQVESSPDAYYEIYGRRYCLTHGDQFRGGDGIIGPLGPVTRGRMKKQARDIVMKQPFDTLCCGHFHTLIQLRHLIVNGSLPGYSEYAYLNNMPPEEPAQALWITNEDGRISHQLPIYLEEASGAPTGDYLRYKKEN
jgi:hypothetical protein